jgi:hypothetical protein
MDVIPTTSPIMKHRMLTTLAFVFTLVLTSCSSPSDPGAVSVSAPSGARPNSVVSEQIIEVEGKKFRQQRIVITDVPYETKLRVVPLN